MGISRQSGVAAEWEVPQTWAGQNASAEVMAPP